MPAPPAPPAGALINLVPSEFLPLRSAEEKMLRAAAEGAIAYCGPSQRDDDPHNDPSKADAPEPEGWDPTRTVRAKLIRWLCVDRKTREFVDPRGVRVYAARISGTLDFSFVTVPFPLAFFRCRLAEEADFAYAQLVHLDLSGAWTRAINADGVDVKGDIFLRDGFNAEGEVRLLGAQVGADLDCTGGTFGNPPQKNTDGDVVAGTGRALNADGIGVEGSIFLGDGFSAEGAVRFLGAQIGGSLHCAGGTFKNPGSKALSADRIDVKGAIFLGNGFSAEGEVRFLGAQTGGDLACTDGAFKNPGRYALNADGIDVKGSIFLRNGFSAEGIISFVGARVGGNLSWTGVQNADRARLDLTSASAGSVVDDPESWPSPGSLRLDGFTYERILDSPTDAKTRLKWLALQPKRPFKPQPHRQLAKVLRESGDARGARRVLFEMENQLWRRDKSPLAPFFRWLLRLTVGFGYRPLRILWPWGILVALGWLFFGVANHAGMIVATQSEANKYLAQHHELPAYYEPFHPLVYSLENSLPFVKLGQVGRWQPSTHSRGATPSGSSWSARFGRFFTSPAFLFGFLWVQILCGWLLATLFVAGVTGLVRRE